MNPTTLFFAAWITPLGAVVIGAGVGIIIGFGIRMAMTYFSLIQMVGVKSPVAIMEVGGTDAIAAQLFYKPRYTRAQVVPANGTISFIRVGTLFSLSNGAARIDVPATPTAGETLTGVQVGEDQVNVYGWDTAGVAYDAMGIKVHVVGPQPDSVAFYRLAVSKALEWWLTGGWGNLRININSHPPAGLCDQWMDWAADWLPRLEKGDVCKIEKCASADGKHNFLRVTLCDGTVLYFDPWIRPDDPVFTQTDYESSHGAPGSAWTSYERTP